MVILYCVFLLFLTTFGIHFEVISGSKIDLEGGLVRKSGYCKTIVFFSQNNIFEASRVPGGNQKRHRKWPRKSMRFFNASGRAKDTKIASVRDPRMIKITLAYFLGSLWWPWWPRVALGGLGLPLGAQGRSKNLALRESRPIMTPFGNHLGLFFIRVRSIWVFFSQLDFMVIS